MAYNRCVALAIAPNNCPYKVRRFNFLDFTGETPASMQLAFNPEVTVASAAGGGWKRHLRVQRIRNAEQVAEARNGTSTTKTWCPRAPQPVQASAIVFGTSTPESEVARLSRHNRGFHAAGRMAPKPAMHVPGGPEESTRPRGNHEGADHFAAEGPCDRLELLQGKVCRVLSTIRSCVFPPRAPARLVRGPWRSL